MITALILDDTYKSPRLSPRKYMNGLKKAWRRRNFKSCFRIRWSVPVKWDTRKRRTVDRANRRKIVVNGRKYSYACLYHMNDKAQKIIAMERAMNIFHRFISPCL